MDPQYTEYYIIREARNVLLAQLVSPRLAAIQFEPLYTVVLSSQEDLQVFARCRRKLLHVTGLPPARLLAQAAEAVSA